LGETSGDKVISDLERLAKLRADGVISSEEFITLKKRVIRQAKLESLQSLDACASLDSISQLKDHSESLSSNAGAAPSDTVTSRGLSASQSRLCGTVVKYLYTKGGFVQVDDENNYNYLPSEAESDPRIIVPGARVEFVPMSGLASSVKLVRRSKAQPSMVRVISGIVAIVFGSFGIDRFMLKDFIGGFLIFSILPAKAFVQMSHIVTIPMNEDALIYLAIIFFGVVRGISYLVTSDKDFFKRYFSKKFGYVEQRYHGYIDAKDIVQLSNKAEAGDVEAQLALAQKHKQGEVNGRTNYPEAMKWYKRAASNGNMAAQYWLAELYSAEEDFENATEYYTRAAEQGHSTAKLRLEWYVVHGH